MIILRPYQRDICDAVFREWTEVQSTIVDAATGTGKTSVFAAIIKRCFPKRAIVINNRRDLVLQTAKRIREETGLSVEVEMGEMKSRSTADMLSSRAQVIVCSLQTLTSGGEGGRLGKFDPNDFGLLVYDEAHGIVAQESKRVVNYFKTNPKLKILGVTATPNRADEEALGQIFETVAYQYSIYDPTHTSPNAIDDGWLVPIRQYPVSVSGLDFSKVRTVAGELNGADLEAVLQAEKPLHKMTQAMFEISHSLEPGSVYELPPSEWEQFARKNGNPKKSLVFTRSVAHAESISHILNRAYAGMSAFVSGKTPDEERTQIVHKFKTGKIQVLCNCNCFSEGFDEPSIEIIFMGAPYKSKSRYAQCIGRGTRTLPGVVDGIETAEERKMAIRISRKPFVTIVDFVGNSGKHKLISSADVLGGNVSDEVVERAIANMRRNGKPADVAEEIQKQIDEEKKRKQDEEARKVRLVARSKYSMTEVDPFDILKITPQRESGYDKGKSFSEKMRGFLMRNGIDPGKMDYAKGKQLIGEIISRHEKKLATLKQVKVLKRYGIDASQMKFEEASFSLTAIANNGWRKPAEMPQFELVSETNELHSKGPIEDGEVPF